MSEITDRRSIGITRQQVADFLATHSGDLTATRTAILVAHPTFDTDYITLDGGGQVTIIDYILSDVESYQ